MLALCLFLCIGPSKNDRSSGNKAIVYYVTLSSSLLQVGGCMFGTNSQHHASVNESFVGVPRKMVC